MRADLPRRALAVDAGLALIVGLASWASAQVVADGFWDRGPGPWRQGPPFRMDPPDLANVQWSIAPAIVVLVCGLALRRVFPRTAYLLVVLGTGVYLLAGGPPGPVLAGPALGMLALATTSAPRAWLPYVAALPPMLWAGFWRQPDLGLTDPGLFAAVIFGTALIMVPSMIAVVRRNRVEADERERETDLRRAAYEERMRIAREVHDVVGHSLSVINLQAGVALHVLDTRPDQVAAALQAIRTSSKEALDEVRSTLAIFRDPAVGEPSAPVPGLGRIPDLAAAVRAAGRDVAVDLAEQPALPVAIDHAAFRIVQEAVTNAVRHAPQASIAIRSERIDGDLVVEVTDTGPAGPLEPGVGIAGMRERAAAVGGTLDIGSGPGGGVLVRATLPLPADESALSPTGEQSR